MKFILIIFLAAAACGGLGAAGAAPQARLPAVPDLTRGEPIPADAPHDWNLGPTGLRGWMFCDRLVTTDARQIAITEVAPGSPADGHFAAGDVLLGVGGRPFAHDPRTELGRAITAAETEEGGGRLSLTRWRAGQTEEVVLLLPVLGSFSATAPYDCLKSQRILERGLGALAARMAAGESAGALEPIPRALNALALLAGGEAAHEPLVRREAEWAATFAADDFKTWYYGYVMIFLAEYITATGDTSVRPGLRRLAMEAATGQSAVGSWGHTFAMADGRLRGYGMMNSPGLPLTIGLVLARQAGVEAPEVARAIELSHRLLRFYSGKGAVPYGDHPAWTETHEDNGKCGMAAVLFHQLGDPHPTSFFTRMAVASHGGERDCGHTGNFFNLLWSLPAIGLAGPHATGAWMDAFGSWYHDLARRWDGTFSHQGPPEPGHDSYHGWDATGAYLLGYARPLKKTVLTGRTANPSALLDPATARALIDDGRGWDNKDRHSFYDRLATSELLDRLGSWSPIVRERAADALARRPDPPVDALIARLDSASTETRVGACQALESLRDAAAPAVPVLRRTLQHDDLWLRIRAATALAAIGAPALPALPEMLERIARGPSPEDPRGMEQRFIASAIFRKMLGREASLNGVDRTHLRTAIARGLQNEDGQARSNVSEIYRHLSFEEIEPLLPAVLEAVRQPAPSGEMFADGVRLNGLKVLARHRIREGISAGADYLRSQNPWASEHRTPEILEILTAYGAAAREVLPHLRDTATLFENGEPDFPRHLSSRKARAVREAITTIEAATEAPELRELK